MVYQRAVLVICGLALTLSGSLARSEYLAFSINEAGKTPLPQDVSGIEPRHLVNVEWGPFAGKRTRIGVLPVDNTSGQRGYGGEVPVNGIEAIVIDTMARTGRFSLVERSILGEVLGEQDLGDRASQPSAARVGQVLGAEFLLQVVITDYQDDTSTTGGGAIGALRRVPIIGGAGIKKKEGRVGLNFRLIDANTSEVVYTDQLESIVKETGLILAGASGDLNVGGFFGQFSKTPIGQAVIAGVNQGVFRLVQQIGSQPARGSIVKVEGNRIWLNLGEGAVTVGDRMELVIKGEELIDPETGINLGSEDTLAGSATVMEVHERFSIAEAGALNATVDRGDVVTSLEPPPSLEYADSWEPPK